jgi:hypothetical protein
VAAILKSYSATCLMNFTQPKSPTDSGIPLEANS